MGELGNKRSASDYGAGRRMLSGVSAGDEEAALKGRRSYGASPVNERVTAGHNHFGSVIVSCDRADLRPLPNGVMVYDDEHAWLDPLPVPVVPRAEVIDELCGAVFGGVKPLHDGEWARATLEVCLAILESADSGRDVRPIHQVKVNRP